ncbi:MAG: cupin domain-containing protein [SAR202 cluster bacterium]|nr:cupin domain-containing protein [SAR202 cluster bacterium]
MVRGLKKLGPIASEVLFENDKVRIWQLTVEPGEASPWHKHARDYVTVTIEDGGITAEYEDGAVLDFEPEIGEAEFLDDNQPHRLVNNSKKRYKNILVELKE